MVKMVKGVIYVDWCAKIHLKNIFTRDLINKEEMAVLKKKAGGVEKGFINNINSTNNIKLYMDTSRYSVTLVFHR